MNQRERSVAAARRRISDARLAAFLHAVRRDEVFAVKLAEKELYRGHSFDAIFYTGEEDGFFLSVEPLGGDRFTIEFGCIAGMLAGDAGTWTVAFDGDSVASATVGDRLVY
jgi:hypothetical protein